MQAAEHYGVERMRAQMADVLVARAMGVSPDGTRPVEWPALEPLAGLPATKDIIAHLRQPRRRWVERYHAGIRLRPESGQAGSPWHSRLARFRTVSDVRPPVRGPRYAWCYRKYSPR